MFPVISHLRCYMIRLFIGLLMHVITYMSMRVALNTNVMNTPARPLNLFDAVQRNRLFTSQMTYVC